MYDEQPETPNAIKLAAIMATENVSMHECSLAAKCIRDLHDLLTRIAVAYPHAVGPNTCPPPPHAYDKCEIYFLLDKAGFIK